MWPLSLPDGMGSASWMAFFVDVIIASAVWGLLSQVEIFFFVRPRGSVKRGIGVGSEPLSFDRENFFRYLPDGVLDDPSGAFIKKADNAVLVQHFPVKKIFTMWFARNASLPCVAYIDLNDSQPGIGYRIPVSPLPLFAVWVP